MATTKRYLIPYSSTLQTHHPQSELEFTESDIWAESTTWSHSPRPDPRPTLKHSSRRQMPAPPTPTRSKMVASSLPVNIPDWSKILRDEYKGDKRSCFNGGDDGGDGEREEEWVPPHEYLARTRMASLSVHEGIGRTLKGRDLSKVRNAVWQKIGFQD